MKPKYNRNFQKIDCEFETTLYLDDVPFGVTYTFSPGEPAKIYGPPENCDPGYPDEVECKNISLGGDTLTDNQANILIEAYGENEFEIFLLEAAR